MINVVVALTFLASIFMGISIGSSAVPPAFGPVTSSGIIGILKSALLAGLAALIGAVVQGGRVSATVGSGMIHGEVQLLQALAILVIASVLVIISVLTKYPMPTAFTVVGAVIGSAFSFGAGPKWGTVTGIVGYWIAVPFLALGAGYVLSLLLRKYLPEGSEKSVQYLTLFMGLFVAYTAGANSVGKAVGPLLSLGYGITMLLVLGGASILIGAWLLSPRIIDAVSFDYSNLGPRRSISALATAAILAQIGVFLGIPISFNQAIIGSTLGSGLIVGKSNIGKRKLGFTAGAWVSAFFIAIGAAYLLSEVLQTLGV